jgi:hypothetical protein
MPQITPVEPLPRKVALFILKQKKKEKTTQGAKHSLHQLRKRRHIGPTCRESPPPIQANIGLGFVISESGSGQSAAGDAQSFKSGSHSLKSER